MLNQERKDMEFFIKNIRFKIDEPMKKRILIIDDEPDVALTLKVVLEDNGFEVDSFTDSLLALKHFKEAGYIYDLLILDIKMPQMNGFELYKEIRKLDDKVKVCFLSALTELKDYEAFRKEVFPKWGERYFIQKPIENDDMLKRINTIIG
ncbi:MAG TPA: response regulator, partial [Nitrososphaeraceae archaeon]|nr:response regulator [Nitrososphaeraceae archaeon]